MARISSNPKYNRFRFDAGSLSLNFVATVRHRGSQPRDLLTMPETLLNWLNLAGLVAPAVSQKDHKEALLLREAIHDTARSVALGTEPNATDIERINRAAEFPVAVPQLYVTADGVKWETKHPVKAALAVIARDAITLMGGAGRERLKRCDSDTCQMLFVDTSPSNRRRWCAMSICGNRAKIRLHRQKKVLKDPKL